jgi:hypothetical protein
MVANLDNPYHPPEYDALFTELNEILSNNDAQLLGLFYSLTVSNTLCRGEFGTTFFCLRHNLFGPATGGDTKYPEALQDRLPMLRSKLAKCCIDYFSNLVKALSCNTSRAEPGSMLTIEEQLVKAVCMMTSYIEQRRPHISDMPLVACHPQLRAVLLHKFKAGRPIVVIVRHIQVDPSGLFGLTYTLGDARALYYDADSTYKLSRSIAPGQETVPCLTFSCWNTYQRGTNRAGLDPTNM